MNSIWQKIKENRDWLLIIFGSALIIFFVRNLMGENLDARIARLSLNEPVDQAGFAPVFVPKPSTEDTIIVEQPLSLKIPERIIIDKINLDAPVEEAVTTTAAISGEEVLQYLVDEKFAAGWHEGTASLGVPGNTVITGYHNAYGKVLEKLINVKVGDPVVLLSSGKAFEYVVANKMILPEKGEPLEVRLENARWIMPSKDERVTLVTC